MAVEQSAVPGFVEATAPARWLLAAGCEGVPLTQTHALARSVVREAAEMWPGWWDTELFGAPHREADVAVLGALHEGLRRLRLVRRRGRRLVTTVRGRELAEDPAALLVVLAGDLGAGDPFTGEVAAAVVEALGGYESIAYGELDRAAFRRIERVPWHGPDGRPPSERDVGWVVGGVLRRGEAYGLVERHPDPAHPRLRCRRLALSPAGRALFGCGAVGRSASSAVFVFDARLVSVRGVSARVAVRGDQHLTALHDAIQEAFGWWDDHLYSFWLDGSFFGDREAELTTPDTPDEGVPTADTPIGELDLQIGQRLGYVFDFGDDWRVRLILLERVAAEAVDHPRVLGVRGTPPPQYPALDD